MSDNLTVGQLKQLLANLDDNVIIRVVVKDVDGDFINYEQPMSAVLEENEVVIRSRDGCLIYDPETALM